ncbi:MAG: LacI family DNA-binding transcriptional regulator [Mobilitalea sp.]
MRKTTIRDVAKEAGVSITTVSHSLSGGGVISQETREHVRKIAAKMQYVPNLNGKNLKAHSSKNIGLFVNSLRGAYYGELADAMFEECTKMGYNLNIFLTDQSMKIMTDILGGRVDGAVILNEWVTKENVEALKSAEIPTVFIDREISGNYISSIVFDSYEEGKMAGEYLLSLGHRKIGYVKGFTNNYDNIERMKGFREALAKAGIELPEEYIWEGLFERDKAYESTIEFLDKKEREVPEAIFAANDLSAFGCIEALQERGYKVPEDVSVMGCDDVQLCDYFSPKLTTIHTSFRNQGIHSIQKIMDLLQKKDCVGDIEKISGKIIARDSCRIRNQEVHK